jgi:ABC-type transporter Mla maintaining outer membrane lipid asymmetry ATPase subunit MlaF
MFPCLHGIELDVILTDREKSIVFNELDFQISNKEIVDAIASTKTGKACGLDSISNEMLKHSQTSYLYNLKGY